MIWLVEGRKIIVLHEQRVFSTFPRRDLPSNNVLFWRDVLVAAADRTYWNLGERLGLEETSGASDVVLSLSLVSLFVSFSHKTETTQWDHPKMTELYHQIGESCEKLFCSSDFLISIFQSLLPSSFLLLFFFSRIEWYQVQRLPNGNEATLYPEGVEP